MTQPTTIERWREKHGVTDELYVFKEKWGRKDELSRGDMRVLRTQVNTDDADTPGHVAVTRDATQLREIPIWMNNDDAVRDLIAIQFPLETHRHRVPALWLHVIRLYRMNEPASEIARLWNETRVGFKEKEPEAEPLFSPADLRKWKEEFGWTPPKEKKKKKAPASDDAPMDAAQVRAIVQQIKWVAAGLRTDGKPRKGKEEDEATQVHEKASLT